MQTAMQSATQTRPFENQGVKHLQDVEKLIRERVVGQEKLIESILVCLICDGHLLIEGMPGLAKTTAAKAVAACISGKFGRVQFTPDLLPSDLTGNEMYRHEDGTFTFRPGPIFNNILLADEINRAPAKVQSALLEAMEEKQVSVANKTYSLPELFMVIATQNPIEQEGTYNLPEAQLDRFLMRVVLDYPSLGDEMKILKRAEASGFATHPYVNKVSVADVLRGRREAQNVYVSDSVRAYIVSLVAATRHPENFDAELGKWIAHGASPRATLALLKASKALAYIRSEEFATPEHVQEVAPSILAHRFYPSYESESSGVSRETIVKRLLTTVATC